jgi:carbohydrate diacid regulator
MKYLERRNKEERLKLLLNEQLAQRIVEEVQKHINEHVIVTNTIGIIVASTDPNRIGAFHEGAKLAISCGETLYMDEDKVKTLEGVRYGIVLPLVINGQAIGVIGITGLPETVAPYAQLLKKLTELFIQDNAYREEQERLEREFELFVFDWLNSRSLDQTLMERAGFFQIDLFSYHQIIVFKTLDAPFTLSYSDIDLIKKQWCKGKNTLFVRWGREKVLAFIASSSPSITYKEVEQLRKIVMSYTDSDIAVGVGQSNPESLQKSYHQAERAVLVSMKRNETVFEEDLIFDIIRYALPDELKQEFIQRTIHCIQGDQVLIETLDSWFKCNLSLKETAADLHVHINTLNYRLKKISEMTSFNLKNTHQLVMLYLAFLFSSEETKNSEKTNIFL